MRLEGKWGDELGEPAVGEKVPILYRKARGVWELRISSWEEKYGDGGEKHREKNQPVDLGKKI